MKPELLLAVALCSTVAGCDIANVHSEGFLNFVPDPGYEWVNPDTLSLAVRWAPGAMHPTLPSIVAAPQPDHWLPLPGYRWSDAPDPSPRHASQGLAAHWQSGLAHGRYPHIRSAEQERHWAAEPGYRFLNENALDVAWQAGSRDGRRPHLTAGASEGRWDPDPGYQTRDGADGLVQAYWSPGLAHPASACLRAGSTEGQWQTISGYRMEVTTEGRLRIVATEPDWTGVIIGTVAFAGGSYFAQRGENDGAAAGAGREVAGHVAAEGFRHALDSWNGGACDGQILPGQWRAGAPAAGTAS